MAAKLANGGEVTVEHGQLVVRTPRKTEEDGRAAPTGEMSAVEVPLDNVSDVSFTRAGRAGYPGAVVVKLVDGAELVLKMDEDDALPLLVAVRSLQTTRHLSDGDAGGTKED